MNSGKSIWITLSGYAAIFISVLLALLAIASLLGGDAGGVTMLGVASLIVAIAGINLLRSPGREVTDRE